MPYNWIAEESDDTPRNLTALGMGAGTALVGNWLALVGLLIGVGVQIIEARMPQGSPRSRTVLGQQKTDFPDITPYEHIVDGVVDGSAALLVRSLARSWTTPTALPQAMPDDADALVG